MQINTGLGTIVLTLCHKVTWLKVGKHVTKQQKGNMHYRNGREAKNGDKIVSLQDVCGPDGKPAGTSIAGFGVLHSAVAGNDYCNGGVAIIPNTQACLCDCLHADDVSAMLAEKGLDKRPAGK